MVPSIKQIVCTSTREGRENLLKLLESTIRITYTHAEKLQVLNGRQEQQTSMAKLLSRIFHLDELHPSELQIHMIPLEYIEGHP